MNALILCALMLASPIANDKHAMTDAQVRTKVHAYLSSIDTPIAAGRWRALGNRAEAVLLEEANGNGLPTHRARALDGLAMLSSPKAAQTFSRIAGDSAQPLNVRYAALRGLRRVLPANELLSTLRPILENAQDFRVRAMAGEQLTLRMPQVACSIVRAQSAREAEEAKATFDRARASCLGY